jgi:hypothetical protein
VELDGELRGRRGFFLRGQWGARNSRRGSLAGGELRSRMHGIEVDKDCDLENGIEVQMDKFYLIIVQDSPEEVTS